MFVTNSSIKLSASCKQIKGNPVPVCHKALANYGVWGGSIVCLEPNDPPKRVEHKDLTYRTHSSFFGLRHLLFFILQTWCASKLFILLSSLQSQMMLNLKMSTLRGQRSSHLFLDSSFE
uniref:Protein translocase subunit SecA n=1 Tax=Anthurium amnicola TaxID=1678845 RepID=A0A1D1XNH0_9ARAE